MPHATAKPLVLPDTGLGFQAALARGTRGLGRDPLFRHHERAPYQLQQAFFGVNQPTRSAVLPRLLPEAQLPAANALNMTVMMAGAIAGPMVGGLLIPIVGYSWLYLIDTITLFATLSAVWRLPALPVENLKLDALADHAEDRR